VGYSEVRRFVAVLVAAIGAAFPSALTFASPPLSAPSPTLSLPPVQQTPSPAPLPSLPPPSASSTAKGTPPPECSLGATRAAHPAQPPSASSSVPSVSPATAQPTACGGPRVSTNGLGPTIITASQRSPKREDAPHSLQHSANHAGGAGLSAEARVAVRTLCSELRQIDDRLHGATTATDPLSSAVVQDSEVAYGVHTPDEAHAPALARQLALQLQIARHEVGLLQDHLHVAHRRSETLQAALDQRELELQRTHDNLVEHMRQSGALLGSLSTIVPQLLPSTPNA
jgi:hypothetical protein